MFARIDCKAVLCLAMLVMSGGITCAEDPLPSAEEVRRLLMPQGDSGSTLVDEKGIPLKKDPLTKHGARLFPIYEEIVSDPKSDPFVLSGAFYAIYAVKADRSRFLESTTKCLAHSEYNVRSAALELMAEIGTERDTAPVVALLSDEDSGVRRKAARTLAKIGGKRDLVAIDVWLSVGEHYKDREHYRGVEKARAELEKRLKSAAPPKEPKK
jgi:hypothetical protein